MKKHVDLFGSHGLGTPPSCLLSVWTELSRNPETRLSHSIPLSGIDSATKNIYVHRFLETAKTGNSPLGTCTMCS